MKKILAGDIYAENTSEEVSGAQPFRLEALFRRHRAPCARLSHYLAGSLASVLDSCALRYLPTLSYDHRSVSALSRVAFKIAVVKNKTCVFACVPFLKDR